MPGSRVNQTLTFSILMLGLTVFIGIIPAVGHGLFILLISLIILFFSLIMPDGLFYSFSDRLRYALIWAAVITFCLVSMIYISNISATHLSLPSESIRAIEGRVLFDSSFSESGNHIMTLYLGNAESISGQRVSGCGLITAVGKEEAIITSGIRIKLYGRISGNGMFIYDRLQVMERNRLNDIREYIIPRLERRILGKENLKCNVLSIMLILGRGETFRCPVKDLASSCGCMHVLALSGMHLHAVTCPVKFIKNKPVQYILKAILTTLFLFIAGPRASLVRSAIFSMLSFLPVHTRLVMTFILQILFFPLSLSNIGSVYGYISVFALIFLAPFISEFLSFAIGKTIGNALGSSLAVLCVNAPLQMILTGCWKPAAVIAGPITSVVAAFSMALGFTELVFGEHLFLNTVNTYVYDFMVSIFNFFSNIPEAGWKAYILMVIISVLFVLLSVFLHRHLKCSIVHNAKIR